MATESDIEQYFSGNDAQLLFTATDDDSNGAPLNLTGAIAIDWKLGKTAKGSPILEKSLTSGIEVTDAANGELTVTITAADTEALKGDYYYELRLTNAEGKKVTLAYGAFPITVNLVRN